jgi:hypothetical protein
VTPHKPRQLKTHPLNPKANNYGRSGPHRRWRPRGWALVLNSRLCRPSRFFRSIADTENSFKKLFELGGSCGGFRQLEYASNSCGVGRWVAVDASGICWEGKAPPGQPTHQCPQGLFLWRSRATFLFRACPSGLLGSLCSGLQ